MKAGVNRNDNNYQFVFHSVCRRVTGGFREVTERGARTPACRRLRPALGTFVSVHCVADDTEHCGARGRRGVRVFRSGAAPDASGVGAGSRCASTRAAGRADSGASAGPGTCSLCPRKLTTSQRGDSIRVCRSIDGCMLDVELPEPEVVVLRKTDRARPRRNRQGFCGRSRDRAHDRGGCIAGQVNAGGDVRVFGPQRHAAVVANGSRECAASTLRNRACAVSDPLARDRPSEHRGYYSRVAPTANGRSSTCAGGGRRIHGRDRRCADEMRAVVSAEPRC